MQFRPPQSHQHPTHASTHPSCCCLQDNEREKLRLTLALHALKSAHAQQRFRCDKGRAALPVGLHASRQAGGLAGRRACRQWCKVVCIHAQSAAAQTLFSCHCSAAAGSTRRRRPACPPAWPTCCRATCAASGACMRRLPTSPPRCAARACQVCCDEARQPRITTVLCCIQVRPPALCAAGHAAVPPCAVPRLSWTPKQPSDFSIPSPPAAQAEYAAAVKETYQLLQARWPLRSAPSPEHACLPSCLLAPLLLARLPCACPLSLTLAVAAVSPALLALCPPAAAATSFAHAQRLPTPRVPSPGGPCRARSLPLTTPSRRCSRQRQTCSTSERCLAAQRAARQVNGRTAGLSWLRWAQAGIFAASTRPAAPDPAADLQSLVVVHFPEAVPRLGVTPLWAAGGTTSVRREQRHVGAV